MPVTKSAKKALSRDRRRTVINLRIKRKLKASVKKMRTSPSADNLKEVYQGLDRAAKKKYIHRKKADRLKSRLARLLANHNKEKQPVKKTAKLKPKTSKKTSK